MGQSPGAASVEVRPEPRPAAGEGVSPCPQRGLVVQWGGQGLCDQLQSRTQVRRWRVGGRFWFKASKWFRCECYAC